MFDIVITSLQQAYSDIERQIIKHNDMKVRMKNVQKNLDELFGIDDLKESLREQITKLETQEQDYIHMLQALNLILSYYQECEKRIISNCELGNQWAFKVSLQNNDFTGIAKELKNMNR